ncbi:hypothetical protein EI42_04913 [Thermosporothrix hazakensis]|jgi:hypothetical protein|uniref:Uncharacterized protein n=2 Tax=Thermosporothrix TaxID=768650 RepID=A0A326U3Q0_THEHA|nr:hypothetical protein [Thermosporothrix hazakensis]PZW23530.1 hypothetical protein EI42_04913 [Thermosporothrix hazakensis]BBH86800.1 hypothetical protein KTC_15510 [Thermosporothrix sp. COM3]GCE51103.1 hypothetical protein KTH_59720 [Thermosporothrix hazakensis]
MAQIGRDCELLLDNVGYFLKPGTYVMKQSRLSHATPRLDGGLAYVDGGPARRVWTMTLLCVDGLKRYNGQRTGVSGQQYRDWLRASYLNNVGRTISFVEPLGGNALPVYFDSYEERVLDLHTQLAALDRPIECNYEVTISLLEA